jgi:RsiW-degrading membrane proteinase PrsW (M82 family)
MKRYIIVVLVPAAIIVILTNRLVPNPSRENIEEYISKALASGNDRIAEKEIKNLVRVDVNNIENHREYIYVHYSQPKRTGKDRSRDDSEIVNYYTVLSNSNCKKTADIGRYCLGHIKYYENDPNGAIYNYLKVGNPNMPFLNNSIGRCYLELGELEKAKPYFEREIELGKIEPGANISGAVHNLWSLFLRQRDYKQLRLLVSRPEYKDQFSAGARRYLAFIDGDFFGYVGAILASYREYVVIDGVIAAAIICGIWLVFIKRLDIFEPEKFRFLLLTLLLSMLFSELGYLLYDFSRITLGFGLGRTPVHQLFYCVFGIGLTEEFVKLVPFFIILFFTRQINESTDYVIYASVSALGFALMENIGYFYPSGLSRIVGRAVTATFFHMALSSFAVYGLVYAKYKKKSILYFFLSFSIACILHGLYDFFIIVRGSLGELRPFAFLLLLVSIVFYARIFRNVLSASDFFTDVGREAGFRLNAFILVCSLSYVIVIQYLIIAFRFGPDFANRQLGFSIAGSYLVVLIIYAHFARIKPQKALWLSIFKSTKTKKLQKQSSSPTDASRPAQHQ